MIVGEQPGDREDLAGRPFVGPAGQLFDEVAARAGLDRGQFYVTNAVKHFKFVARGKRRIHQRPGLSEIRACKPWLNQEIALLDPQVIVAMGATALHAVTGSGKGITSRRGHLEQTRDGRAVFVTFHPSYLLRLPDAGHRLEQTELFVQDLTKVRQMLN